METNRATKTLLLTSDDFTALTTDGSIYINKALWINPEEIGFAKCDVDAVAVRIALPAEPTQWQLVLA